MRILVAGADGYLGWNLMNYLPMFGHEVVGIDNGLRRLLVEDVGSESLFPLRDPQERGLILCDIALSPATFRSVVAELRPDAIVHLAEIPSAPFSMLDRWGAAMSQINNIGGTLHLLWTLKEFPDIHLVKLGTMGEYSDWIYENVPIPEESRVEARIRGVDVEIPTPKWTGSFYHWSKIYDSYNIEFACRLWGLRATDLNQGVVFGTRIGELSDDNLSRFDYDDVFGTVVNRFVAQAVVGHPLTVYGEGGQTRGYIALRDSMDAIRRVCENPPSAGEFRVINQLTQVLSVREIAELVSSLTGVDIMHIENPRKEAEAHNYVPTFKKLKKLGLSDPLMVADALPSMIKDVKQFRGRVDERVIAPRHDWMEGGQDDLKLDSENSGLQGFDVPTMLGGDGETKPN